MNENVSYSPIPPGYFEGRMPTAEEAGAQALREEELATMKKMLAELERELPDLERQLLEMNRNLPPGRRIGIKVKIGLGVIVIAFVECMLIANTARYALDFVQSMTGAVLFVGVLALISAGLEAYADVLTKNRRTLDRLMGWIFVLCGGFYLYSFAQEFGKMDDLGSGLLGGFDYRKMLYSQIGTEVAFTYAMFSKIRHWMADLKIEKPNPKYTALAAKIENIRAKIEELKLGIGTRLREITAYAGTVAKAKRAEDRRKRFAAAWAALNAEPDTKTKKN